MFTDLFLTAWRCFRIYWPHRYLVKPQKSRCQFGVQKDGLSLVRLAAQGRKLLFLTCKFTGFDPCGADTDSELNLLQIVLRLPQFRQSFVSLLPLFQQLGIGSCCSALITTLRRSASRAEQGTGAVRLSE